MGISNRHNQKFWEGWFTKTKKTPKPPDKIIPGITSPIPASDKDNHINIQKLQEMQMQVEQARYQVQVMAAKAEADIQAAQARAQSTAYKNVMGYPSLGTMLIDQQGSEYRVDRQYDLHLPNPGVELRINKLYAGLGDPGMNVSHVTVYWVPTKQGLGIKYGDPDLWPDPNQPVIYCYVDSEDQVYVGVPEHEGVFSSSRPLGSKNSTLWRKVQNWVNESANVYALLEYKKTNDGYDNRSGYVIPRELNPEEKEKFDVFTNALKLRAEIIEEARQQEA